MNKSEPIVSDINNSMTDELTITIFRYTIELNLYFTESVWNTSELVFKSAHLASCALWGRLYNWAGFLILVANGQSGDDASGYVHVSFKIGSDKERVMPVSVCLMKS